MEDAVPRIVIAAGGTAGHVVPALAVADALRARGAEVEFVGGERAEAGLVPAAGYPFHRLRVEGIDRANPLRAARAVLLAGGATVQARGLLRRLAPGAVLGGGGYVAGPVGLAARSLGIPVVLTEADSHLGMTNRLLAPLARRVFLAFPVEGRHGPRWEVSGRPVPAGTGSADRNVARERFGIAPGEACVLVFGGSLGARRLNDATIDAFGTAAPGAVLHASGRRDHGDLRRRLDELGSPPHYHLYPYIEPFAGPLAAADLAVARGGGRGAGAAGRAAAVGARAVPARHGGPPDEERALGGASGGRPGGTGPRAGRPPARPRGGGAPGRATADGGDGERGGRGRATGRRRADRGRAPAAGPPGLRSARCRATPPSPSKGAACTSSASAGGGGGGAP